MSARALEISDPFLTFSWHFQCLRACLTDRRRIRSTARRSGAASLYPTYGLFEIRTFQDLHRMPNNSISSQTGSECGRSSISSGSPASASPGAQVDGAQEQATNLELDAV